MKHDEAGKIIGKAAPWTRDLPTGQEADLPEGFAEAEPGAFPGAWTLRGPRGWEDGYVFLKKKEFLWKLSG